MKPLRRQAYAWAAAVSCALTIWGAWGDTLYLENGDRISGVLGTLAEGKLTFTTPYAGELRVDLGSVRAIATDEPVAVRLKDGTVHEGRLIVENETQVIRVGESARPFPLKQIEGLAHDVPSLETTTGAATVRKWTGTLDAGASLRSGYTDTLDSNLGVTLVRKRTRDTLTLELTGAYGEVDSEVNTRRLRGSAKWQYYPRERLYVFGRSAAEHDPGRKLDLRFETGAGAGLDVLQSERRTLALEGGMDYAWDRWNLYGLRELENAKLAARTGSRANLASFIETQIAKPAALWGSGDLVTGLRLAARAIDPGVDQETRTEDHIYLHLGGDYKQTLFGNSTLSEKLTVLPRLTDLGEYRVTSELAFDTPLSDRLGIRFNLKTDYESDTGNGDDEVTNTFVTTLRYTF